jgi:hypothetical protein
MVSLTQHLYSRGKCARALSPPYHFILSTILLTKHCYSLESLKAPCLKSGVSRVVPLRGARAIRKWGLMGGPQVIGSLPSKGITGLWSLPLPFYFLADEVRGLFGNGSCYFHLAKPILNPRDPKLWVCLILDGASKTMSQYNHYLFVS